MTERNTLSTPREREHVAPSTGPHAVPRAVLRPVGPDGGRAWQLASAGAALLVVLAIAWWGWSAFAPLPAPPSGSADQPPEVPSFNDSPRRAGVGEALARLQRNNLFAPDRAPWPLTGQAIAGSDAGGSRPDPADAPAIEVIKGPGDLRVTATESAPERVRKALEAIALRGIRSSRSSDVALFSFPLEGGDNPLKSRPFAAGDTFSESKNPDDKWRIEAIDRVTDTVYLSRAGITLALDVFPGGRRSATQSPALNSAAGSTPGSDTLQSTTAGGASTAGTAGEPVIQARTFEEIEAELRAAGLSEADIADLLARARAAPAPATQPIEPALAEEPKPTVPQSMPAGMEEIIRMMASGTAPIPGAGAEGDQPATEPEAGGSDPTPGEP